MSSRAHHILVMSPRFAPSRAEGDAVGEAARALTHSISTDKSRPSVTVFTPAETHGGIEIVRPQSGGLRPRNGNFSIHRSRGLLIESEPRAVLELAHATALTQVIVGYELHTNDLLTTLATRLHDRDDQPTLTLVVEEEPTHKALANLMALADLDRTRVVTTTGRLADELKASLPAATAVSTVKGRRALMQVTTAPASVAVGF